MKETESKQVLDSSHLGTLEELLSDKKYGSIPLVIQDVTIVQIDNSEKYIIKN